VERWALVVVDGTRRGRSRHHALVALAVLASVLGALLFGRVLASDPVAYHLTVWPFADGRDRDEARQVADATAAARGEAERSADLSGVPAAMRRSGVELLAVEVRNPRGQEGSALVRLRIRVRDDPRLTVEQRCREVMVTGRTAGEVVSRRVACPPAGPADVGRRPDPAG
jgi:hypothetical protein